MKISDRARLTAFNGSCSADSEINTEENYWLLIGTAGTIVALPDDYDFPDIKRVLVCFDVPPSSLGLACHNEIQNSLWILESDLEPIE